MFLGLFVKKKKRDGPHVEYNIIFKCLCATSVRFLNSLLFFGRVGRSAIGLLNELRGHNSAHMSNLHSKALFSRKRNRICPNSCLPK